MKQLLYTIKELLENELPKNTFEEIYVGKEPDMLNDKVMPCASIRYTGGSFDLEAPTQHDRFTARVAITIYMSKKRGIAKQHSKGSPAAIDALMDLILSTNYNQNGYHEYAEGKSIIGILRKHITLKGDTQNTLNELSYNHDVEFELIEGDDQPIIGAVININPRMLIQVTNRI